VRALLTQRSELCQGGMAFTEGSHGESQMDFVGYEYGELNVFSQTSAQPTLKLSNSILSIDSPILLNIEGHNLIPILFHDPALLGSLKRIS
jgi:hypothetical protein